MSKSTVETNTLIAERVPPGDRWELCNSKEVYDSLTKVLNAWYIQTREKTEFRLSPLDGKLYVIRQEEVPFPPPETFDIYGETY
jgi:hypothetical protein